MTPGLRRVGLVGAEADLRQGPAGRGLPGRAVLPALRHGAVRPRGGAGLREGRRPVGVRRLAADLRAVGRHSASTCWSGRPRRGRWCPTPPSRSTRTVTYVGRAHRGRADVRTSPSRWPAQVLGDEAASVAAATRAGTGALDATSGRSTTSSWTMPARRPTSWCSPTTSPPTTAPAWCTRRRPSAPTTCAVCRAYGLPVVNPIGTRRALRCRRRRWSAACSSRTPTRAGRRPARAAGCCSGTCPTRTATRTAGAATRR